VRLWLQRVGLYLWQRTLPHAEDWIWLVDRVAEAAGGKCLVLVGARRSWLCGRDFVLMHSDVTLLYAEVMERSSGDDRVEARRSGVFFRSATTRDWHFQASKSPT
jgi:hypothetical protein